MRMFANDSRQFKFSVLLEICRQAFAGDLDEAEVHARARELVSLSSPRVRCCVYKEREVLRQRVRLSLGQMASDTAPYNPRQIVQVIDAACDGCSIRKIRVTDNCRKCMAKACMEACHFGAISMGSDRSQIDYDKCRECGMCAKACPYNAIVVTERPCYAHCPVQAISWDENGIAVIDEKKCINCGQCELSCPFGACEDISWVVPVITALKMDIPSYAIVAPSIQGQFGNATLAQIRKGIEMLGFEKCYEVALGADAVAKYEAEELREHMEAGIPLTTSCCPGFVNMQKMHFPEIYEKNKSTTVSPMMALANKLKKEHPDHGIVFIGPCVAKKQEAMEYVSAVDYVLTFEELAAMVAAKEIDFSKIEVGEDGHASNYGRGFAASGGVSAAVQQARKENSEEPVNAIFANGAFECKQQLMMIKAGKFPADILEGMCCVGGCIGGPAAIVSPQIAKGRMVKENMTNKAETIHGSLEKNSFDGVTMHVVKKEEESIHAGD